MTVRRAIGALLDRVVFRIARPLYSLRARERGLVWAELTQVDGRKVFVNLAYAVMLKPFTVVQEDKPAQGTVVHFMDGKTSAEVWESPSEIMTRYRGIPEDDR